MTKSINKPAGYWSPTVIGFVNYLRDNSFKFAPKIEINNKNNTESYEYVHGKDLEEFGIKENQNFIFQSATILKSFHEISEGYLDTQNTKWKLKGILNPEVICHGDFAPYNLIVNNNNIVALIDYEYCHPNKKIWDISYAVYRMAPICDKTNPLNFGSIEQKLKRAELFLSEYRDESFDLKMILEYIPIRLEWTIKLIEENMKMGDKKFKEDYSKGHTILYKNDIQFCRDLLKKI